MSHIRNTIELLCTILEQNGTFKIKAEHFRLAKFDKDDVTELHWKLLFQLLYYSEHGEIDSVAQKAYDQLTREELCVYVKTTLQCCGYYSAEFAGLPSDMTTGSRELLLAIGWLICKENIIQKFMYSCTSPLDNEDTAFVDGKVSESTPLESPAPSNSTTDKVKQMLWFNNKIRMNLRLLHATCRDKSQLKHQVHASTYGVSTDPERNHLTLYEVSLLRHPDLLKKSLDLLDKDNVRLTNLLKWKDHEDVFWKWMESVLDEKLKEHHETTKEKNISSGINNIMEGSMNYLIESHHNLQESIMKYEYIVDQLENLWDSKVTDIREQDLDNILKEIDAEILRQKENISQLSCRNYLRLQNTQPRFIYVKKVENNKGGLVSLGHPSKFYKQHDDHIQDIEDEILMLKGIVETLENEIDSKQESFKSELQEISSRLHQTVCIPPMGRRSYNATSEL